MRAEYLDIVTVAFEGHLTLSRVQEVLGTASQKLVSARSLIIDCRRMSGYEQPARDAFVAWHREHRAQVDAVGVVTDRMLWHMIVSAMALASGQQMRAFSSLEDARAWCASARD